MTESSKEEYKVGRPIYAEFKYPNNVVVSVTEFEKFSAILYLEPEQVKVLTGVTVVERVSGDHKNEADT